MQGLFWSYIRSWENVGQSIYQNVHSLQFFTWGFSPSRAPRKTGDDVCVKGGVIEWVIVVTFVSDEAIQYFFLFEAKEDFDQKQK